ncbi:MAG: HAMP domain-containing histidine kinase [Lachnospiraceae bacterium]|nr:HAMP domain-containing histidine kinase [Lachnospiraceae bacterium]
MIIAIVLLGILIIVLLGHIIIYRRQVAQLCRQLAFINTNKTRAEPQVDINLPELNKLVEQIRILNERLKETQINCLRQDEALRETIANLSHDIRTPLTSLDGYFQLLSAEGVTQERKEYYTGIIRSRLESLSEMLDELFTYAKLQDPNYEIELMPMDMTAVTAEVLLSFYDDIKKNGDSPQIELPDEVITINSSKSAYTRIIQNIVKNALMHGRNLSVKMFRESGEAVVICSDEPLNSDVRIDIDRVFDRFYKADKARSGKGSGLGLAISKELVIKMGGRIEARYENGIFAIEIAFPVTDDQVDRRS